MQFAEQFSDFEIVSPSATHLSWAHIVEVLPLKTQDAKLYYLSEASRGVIGRDKMRAMINRKAYERREIADTQITDTARVPQGAFKDPYLFDILGLKMNFKKRILNPRYCANFKISFWNLAKDLRLSKGKSE